MTERYRKRFKGRPSKKEIYDNNKNEIENYEKNLKLNLEAKRKDLDILSTSVVPHQLGLVRTYLWISSLSIPVAIVAFRNISTLDIYIRIPLIFALLCCIAMAVLCLFAIHNTRDRYMAHIINDDDWSYLAQNKWEHIEGLLKMLNITQSALAGSQKTVEKTAKYLRISLWLIFTSIVLFMISVTLYFTFYLMKGGIGMAEDSKETRPVASSQTSTQAPKIQANSYERPRSSNETYDHAEIRSGHNVTSSDKTGPDQNKQKVTI